MKIPFSAVYSKRIIIEKKGNKLAIIGNLPSEDLAKFLEELEKRGLKISLRQIVTGWCG